MTEKIHKKVSIQLSELPKIRHHSTYQQKSHTHQQKTQIPNLNRTHLSKICHYRNLTYYLDDKQNDRSFKSFKKKKTKLQVHLSEKFHNFKDFTNINQTKISQTFYRKKGQKENLKKITHLQKRKVFNLEKQQPFMGTKDGQFPLLKSQEFYRVPIIVLDYRIQMTFLKHYCYDNSFPLIRVGATLNCINNQLYLFGGCPDTSQTCLPFHRLKPPSYQWTTLKTPSQPSISLMYHTSTVYKQYLILIGGFSLEKNQLKKHYNSFIYIYNTDTKLWQYVNWGVRLKHHASSIVGNNLIVHGGLNQGDQTQNKLYWISLNNSGNFALSKVQDFSSSQILSHHAMVNTLGEEIRFRAKFSVDGFLIFGGKRQDETLSNELLLIQAKRLKINEEETNQIKKWQVVETKGPKPEPRMCHTFDILPGKGLCVLMGGINIRNEYLHDLWIFDLFGLNWSQIEQVPLLTLTRGIAYHCTAVKNSDIYLYGGIQKAETKKYFYLIQTQKIKRQNSKHQSRKKLQTSTNFISFRAFQ